MATGTGTWATRPTMAGAMTAAEDRRIGEAAVDQAERPAGLAG